MGQRKLKKKGNELKKRGKNKAGKINNERRKK
jgi:hypothetical protein